MRCHILYKNSSAAFTLIELLTVVGILLIISAIGAGSYQGALNRARTARVAAEFRTYAAAIETYHVDNNAWPRMSHATFYGDPDFDALDGFAVNGVLSRSVTTPVAYLTTVNRIDPFMVGNTSAPPDEQAYTFQVPGEYSRKLPGSVFWPAAEKYYGGWRLVSVGPDRYFDHGFANSAQLIYDPTNGAVSLGNIFRSQAQATSPPPIPGLLGAH